MPSSHRLAARLRGVAAGLLTAALAIGAHGAAGGTLPPGAATAQLGVLAAAAGAVTATCHRAADTRVLILLLAAGQLLGHGLLSVAGHAHAPVSASGTAVMLTAHVAAIVIAAVLIAAGDRLCRAMSRAVGQAVRLVSRPVEAEPVVAIRHLDQPLRSALLLAASMSRRGPPAGLRHRPTIP